MHQINKLNTKIKEAFRNLLSLQSEMKLFVDMYKKKVTKVCTISFYSYVFSIGVKINSSV